MLTQDELGKHSVEMNQVFGDNAKDLDMGLRIILGNIRTRFDEGEYDAQTAGELHGMAVSTYHQHKATNNPVGPKPNA